MGVIQNQPVLDPGEGERGNAAHGDDRGHRPGQHDRGSGWRTSTSPAGTADMVGTYTAAPSGASVDGGAARDERERNSSNSSFALEAFTCSWSTSTSGTYSLFDAKQAAWVVGSQAAYGAPITNGATLGSSITKPVLRRPQRAGPRCLDDHLFEPVLGHHHAHQQRQLLGGIRPERRLRHHLDPRHQDRELLGQQLQRRQGHPVAVGERWNAEPLDRHAAGQGRHQRCAHELPTVAGRGERGPGFLLRHGIDREARATAGTTRASASCSPGRTFRRRPPRPCRVPTSSRATR